MLFSITGDQMKKLLIAGIAAAAFCSTPAFAANLLDWTGFYVGGTTGYSWGRANVDGTFFQSPAYPNYPADAAAVDSALTKRISANGFTDGVQVGYNFQTNSIVWGLEVDFDYLAARGSKSGTFSFPSFPATLFTINQSVSADWLLTVRPRIGFVSGRSLIYGTGGLAVANYALTESNIFCCGFVENLSYSSTKTGWVIGAGWESMLSHNWSVKAEYLYVDLGKVGGPGFLTPTPILPQIDILTHSEHLTLNILRVGVNYKFGSQ